jgi:hypothetical protein
MTTLFMTKNILGYSEKANIKKGIVKSIITSEGSASDITFAYYFSSFSF